MAGPAPPLVPDLAPVDGETRAARALEVAFLGGPADLTREQVEDLADVDPEATRRLWRALGFADLEPGVPSLTEADAVALATTGRLVREQGIDPRTAEALARALGQAMGHLAAAQVETVVEVLSRDPELVRLARESPVALVEEVLPLLQPVTGPMQELLLYVWRRHVVAGAQRALAGAGMPVAETALAVGFADLVGWTSATRDMGTAELAALIETFESAAFDLVVSYGGRVVKTLGDEVLFTAPTARAGARIGLALAGAFAERGPVPPVRVGLAWGPALARAGDVFGPVVNLASRCTSLARPSTVLVERAFARAVEGDGAFVLRPMSPRRVRGYDRLEVAVLRHGAA